MGKPRPSDRTPRSSWSAIAFSVVVSPSGHCPPGQHANRLIGRQAGDGADGRRRGDAAVLEIGVDSLAQDSGIGHTTGEELTRPGGGPNISASRAPPSTARSIAGSTAPLMRTGVPVGNATSIRLETPSAFDGATAAASGGSGTTATGAKPDMAVASNSRRQVKTSPVPINVSVRHDLGHRARRQGLAHDPQLVLSRPKRLRLQLRRRGG